MLNNNEMSLTEARHIVDTDIAHKDTAALDYLLADARGRWFLMRLCERCHIHSTTYPDEDNINRMLVYEGERRIALNILANISIMGERAVEAKQLAEREYTAALNYHASLLQLGEENEKGDE